MAQKTSSGHPTRKIIATVVFALSLVVNALAGGTTLINGRTTGEVSALHPTLFTPAGFTFAIWGIIYLLVTVYAIRQFVSGGTPAEKNADILSSGMAQPFTILSALNICWLFAWQFDIIWLAMLLIIAMLITLAHISGTIARSTLTAVDWLTIRLPFSIYFGWITIATIANASVLLVSAHWSGWGIGDSTWTAIILVVGAAIGLAVTLTRKDWSYLAVFIWAYLGILTRHLSVSGYNDAYPVVVYTLIALLVVLAAATIYVLVRWPLGARAD